MNMLTDEILLTVSERSGAKSIWGRYNHVYDWSYDALNNKVSTWSLAPTDWSRTAAIIMRDHLIASKLKEIGVKKVLDVGSDTGHFLAVLASYGIEAVGLDASSEACQFVDNKKVNKCYHLSIQDLINLKELGNSYDCLTCLNITQAKWENEALKKEFINWSAEHFQYQVLSDFTNQSRRWDQLELVHKFNIGRFSYNHLIQFLARVLGIDIVLHYVGIQKLFQTKK